MDVIEVGRGDMSWIDLVQDGKQWRVVLNTVMNFSDSIK